MERKLTFLVTLTVLSFTLLVGLLLFWHLYPYEPIITSPRPFPIIHPQNKVVEQGDHVVYEFQYDKKLKVLPTIRRQFVDGIVFNVAGTDSPTVTDVGTGTARVEVDIPDTLPPGNYIIRIFADYDINPIRDIRITNVTEQFEVVGSSK